MKREKGALRGMHHCFRLQDDHKGTKEPFWFYSSLSPQKTSFVFITKVSYSVSSRHSFSDVSTLAIVPLWVGYYWTEHNEARISMSTSFSGALITCPTSQWISLGEKYGCTQPADTEKEAQRSGCWWASEYDRSF